MQPSSDDVAGFERDPVQNVLMWHLQMYHTDEFARGPALDATDDETNAYWDSFLARFKVDDDRKREIVDQYLAFVGSECVAPPSRVSGPLGSLVSFLSLSLCTRRLLLVRGGRGAREGGSMRIGGGWEALSAHR